MKSHRLQDLVLFISQLGIWALLNVAPAAICYLIDPSSDRYVSFLFLSAGMLAPMCLTYMLTFYVTVPLLFYRGHRWLFILATVLLSLGCHVHFFLHDVSSLGVFEQNDYYSFVSVSVTLHLLVASAAFGIRGFIRSREIQAQLQEERRKTAEAELTWLKNQLNPHFLFNSLNNISSLTQIDPDQAQDAIGQLSDLLRYALYESNKPLVPLTGEVEFLHNYIAMMRLRCSSMTQVDVDLQAGCTDKTVQIAPLLFIAFVENAFKHGSSASQPSHISVSLHHDEEGLLKFSCRNTNLPKPDTDRSGSGVGLENTRRRLELLYHGRYSWQQGIEDNIFCITIEIRL